MEMPDRESSEEAWSRLARTYDPIKVASIDGTDREPHDAGVVRALRSHYAPDPGVRGRAPCTVLVAGLNPRTTQMYPSVLPQEVMKALSKTFQTIGEQVAEEMGRWGSVARCRLVRDLVTGKSKRYALVEFATAEEAVEAARRADGEPLHGAALTAERELQRTLPGWRPRRLGGGFGGRKESGQLRFGCRRRPFARPIPPSTPSPPSPRTSRSQLS